MKIVFMGTNEWAIPTLDVLFRSGYYIKGILTQPDRLAGRKRKLVANPVKHWALVKGLSVFTPDKADCSETLNILKVMSPDIILVCAYGQLLPQSILDLPKLGCFNIHFSKLPRWRGASPVQAAIIGGDTETGVSIQRMVLRLDAGPLVAESCSEPIYANDTTLTLGKRLADLAGTLLRSSLQRLLEGNFLEKSQNDSEAKICRLIRKEDGRALWEEETAIMLERRIRAFTPWPGLYCFEANGKRLQIIQAEVTNSNLKPGWVNEKLVIGTQKDGLKVLRIREEGKKELCARDFINGHRKLPGSCLN